MPALDPVAPFLALIDRIISLVKARDLRRREYFEKIIEPLYTQFKPLGEDYLKLFQEAQEAILSSKKGKRSEAVSEIKKRRNEFAATRAQLRALLEVCGKDAVKKKDEDLREFVFVILTFFEPVVLTSVPTSLGQELVQFFDAWERSNYVEGFADSYLPSAAARLEAVWYEIGGRYMELKLKSVGE